MCKWSEASEQSGADKVISETVGKEGHLGSCCEESGVYNTIGIVIKEANLALRESDILAVLKVEMARAFTRELYPFTWIETPMNSFSV